MYANEKTKVIPHRQTLKRIMPLQILGLITLAGVLGKFTHVPAPLSCDGSAYESETDIALNVCKLNSLDETLDIAFLETATGDKCKLRTPKRGIFSIASREVLFYPKDNIRRLEPISQYIVDAGKL